MLPAGSTGAVLALLLSHFVWIAFGLLHTELTPAAGLWPSWKLRAVEGRQPVTWAVLLRQLCSHETEKSQGVTFPFHDMDLPRAFVTRQEFSNFHPWILIFLGMVYRLSGWRYSQ